MKTSSHQRKVTGWNDGYNEKQDKMNVDNKRQSNKKKLRNKKRNKNVQAIYLS